MSEAFQDGVDFILDGLAAALELERELGVRAVDIDRSLLVPPAPAATPQVAPVAPAAAPVAPLRPAALQPQPAGGLASPVRPAAPAPAASAANGQYDFVFVHERALSPKGVEMMAKIVAAMGKTADTAPVVVVPPVPRARIVVALGPRALRMFFPGLRGSPGEWLKSADGRDVLVSTSPEDIVRYPTVTPALKKIKLEMWHNLKVVMQRTRQ